MAIKVTYTLDNETVERIRRAATRANKPQSAIVREAVAHYAAEPDRPGREEIRRKLRLLDAIMATPPTRTARAVDQELRELRKSRRTGWRRREPRRR
jgi:predicted transcriptional regulator